jgi:hypothetical protein
MFSGPPLPLPPDFPIRRLLPLINPVQHPGAWVRDSGAAHRLAITADGRCARVIIGQDLGELLRDCRWVVLQADGRPISLPTGRVIQWRAIQVVTGALHGPTRERLKEIFPDAEVDTTGFKVPTRSFSPEEVLASCIAHGIQVMKTGIVYSVESRP